MHCKDTTCGMCTLCRYKATDLDSSDSALDAGCSGCQQVPDVTSHMTQLQQQLLYAHCFVPRFLSLINQLTNQSLVALLTMINAAGQAYNSAAAVKRNHSITHTRNIQKNLCDLNL